MRHDRFILACTLLVTVGCVGRKNVQCIDGSSCDLAGGGVCVSAATGNHWCAYPDGACAGGLRFSDFDTGDGLGGTCVGDDVDGGSEIDASTDANNPIGWALAVSGVGSAYVMGTASDPAGNLYVTGIFDGDANMGSLRVSSSGDTDVFVAKVSAQGVVQWFKNYGGTSTDDGWRVVADAQGVTIGGDFRGAVNFGDGIRNSAGVADVFVLRLNTEGQFLWAVTAGGTASDSVDAMTSDSAGNVYVMGKFLGNVSFGGLALIPQNSVDIYLAKYSPTGAHLWSVRMGGMQTEDPGDVAIVDGDVIVAGYFAGQIDLGGGPLSATGTSTDIFIARLRASDAGHLWSQAHGGSGQEDAVDVIPSRDGIAVTGHFEAVATFGTDVLSSTAGEDAFVWKLSATGSHAWAKRFGGPGMDRGRLLVEAPNGDLALSGSYDQPFTAGGTLLPLIPRGTFVMHLHRNGDAFYARGMGGGSQTSVGVGAPVVDGDLVLGGSFIGTIDFFGHMLNNGSTVGETDGFLIRE